MFCKSWGNITLGPPQISEEYKHKPHSFQIKTADASGTELIIKITDQSERSLLFMFLIGQYLIQPKVPNWKYGTITDKQSPNRAVGWK